MNELDELTELHKKRNRAKFWAGCLTATAFQSLYQDFKGQAGMQEVVQNHWISGWWTVPLALICLGWAYYLYHK